MTTIAFNRAAYFDASTPATPGTWLRAILNDPSRYTVETNGPNKLVLVSNGAGFTAGWKVEVLPVGSISPTVTGGYAGSIQALNLYDPAGVLVSSITDLPDGATFALITGANWLEIFGADFLGSEEADTLTGYAGGDDFLQGGAGADRLHGGTGEGADILVGGAGDDTLNGGAGDDYLEAGLGADVVDGGDGVDIALLDEANAPLTVWLNQAGPGIRVDNVELVVLGDAGARVIGSFKDEAVIGGAGRDIIDGDLGDDLIAGLGGDDQLHGGAGNDIFDGGEGADLIDGGAGFDIVDYSAAKGGVTVDLRVAGAQQTGQGLDTVTGIEGLVSGDFGDTLSGDAQANQLESGGGDDLIDAGAGADTLTGGAGADQLFGGEGNDQVSDEAGRNFLRGGAGDDSISGGSDFDDAHGNEGNDTVAGGLGDDWVVGARTSTSCSAARATTSSTATWAMTAATAAMGPTSCAAAKPRTCCRAARGTTGCRATVATTLSRAAPARTSSTARRTPASTASSTSAAPRATASSSTPAPRTPCAKRPPIPSSTWAAATRWCWWASTCRNCRPAGSSAPRAAFAVELAPWGRRFCGSRAGGSAERRLVLARHGLDDRLERGAGLGAHLVVGGVLDGMVDEHVARVVHAQHLALGLGGLSKFAGGDGDGGNALDLEPHSVVQTARRA